MEQPADRNEQWEQVKQRLYKIKTDDSNFQQAVALIKNQNQRIGALQGWNNKYRGQISLLKKEQQILLTDLEAERQRLKKHKEALLKLVQDKADLVQERREILKELKDFDEKVENVKNAYNIFSKNDSKLSFAQRFHVVMLAIKELISPSQESETIVEIQSQSTDPTEPFEDKPWMKNDAANIQRAIRDD